jgi:GTPase SAR1 family protein
LTNYIVFTGPAGSGKTVMTNAMAEWLRRQKLSVTTINLDPAVEWLPYKPDVDVREYVNARDVAKKHGLGPNGALLASMDLLYSMISDLKKEIIENESVINIIDTPGQLELFAYRDTGPLLIDKIVPPNHGVVVFLIDSGFTYTMDNLLSLLLLSYSIELRHNHPQIRAITKSDLLSPERLDFIRRLNESPEELEAYYSEIKDPFLRDLVRGIVERGLELYPVSGVTEEGIDLLYAEIENTLHLQGLLESNI